MDLNHRFDSTTSASLWGPFLKVVDPPGMKGIVDIIAGIHRWEAKVAVLRSRYCEDLSSTSKHAIFIGVMPKEYQDLIW